MRQARIVYTNNGISGTEAYRLEVWSEQYKEWGLDTEFEMVNPREYPEASGNNYVHYQLVKRVVQLCNLGYRIGEKIIDMSQ